MAAKQQHTTQEYIMQFTTALKKRNIKDIDDILADYQDYFMQSKIKGYSDAEAIRRLPSAHELAASYDDSPSIPGTTQISTTKGQPSSAQRLTVFGVTLAGDILLLPILFITILLLACFGIVGVCLMITGPLLFIPDSMLGQVNVARLPILQLLPTALLFVSSGIAIIGICAAVCERIYSTYRASIVVRRWLLTGNHDNHLKLVPSIRKQHRTSLYRITLIAGAAAALLVLILGILSWLTEGTVNFPSTWNI